MAVHALMCRPSYFGVYYEINPWMQESRRGGQNPVDIKLADYQWRQLFLALQREGVICHFIPPVRDLPDMVFTANAGLIISNQVVLSNFRYQERRGEKEHFRRFFLSHGYNLITELGENVYFEGHGDALWFGDTLVFGYGIRSDENGVKLVASMLNRKCVFLELINERYYHLDTCFCPIGDLILFYPAAFKKSSRQVIERLGKVVAVSAGEARNFLCNAVPLRKDSHWKIITNPIGRAAARMLERHDIEVEQLDLSEFKKAGGGPRCLTLFI